VSSLEQLEQLMAPDGRRFYGVALAAIGDDGDWIIAAGHVEPRRMVAGSEAYARAAGLGSLRDLYGGDGGDYHPLATALALIEHGMAAVRQPYCTHGGHDEGETCPTSPAEWGVDWAESTPDRTVPVTILDWAL
jgi:hypothetical protein